MVSINEVQDTDLDFSQLDLIYSRLSCLAFSTGMYPYYNRYGSSIADYVHYANHFLEKNKTLIASIKDMNSSEEKSIEQISNLIKISFECIMLNIFYLKSIGIPVTNCWQEFVKEMSSRKIKCEDIKNIFTENHQYDANIEGALFKATEEREQMIKFAADLSKKLNEI